MKKCWVKVDVTNYTTMKNETEWLKGELIGKKDLSYTVIYKKNNVKLVEDFDPEHFEYDKPKSVKKKDPVQSRTKWWKLFYLVIHFGIIAIFVAVTPKMEPFGGIAFILINQLIFLCAGSIFENVMEMIIRQEEIHKMLKDIEKAIEIEV